MTVAEGGASTLIAIVVAHLLNCNASEKKLRGTFQLFFLSFWDPGPGLEFLVESPSEFLHQQKKLVTNKWTA